MFRLVAELGRRNVVRVAAIYIGIAWAAIHAGTILGETWDAPHWVMRLVTIFFVLGLPVAAAFAWVFELTPEGFRRTSEVDPSLSLTHRTARRLDIVIIALILVVGAMFGGESLLTRPQVQQAGVLAARSASLNPGSAISVAVMPFANLSSDKEQEFFSDGMTEEITTALAKIPDLRVVARESAFQFKGEKKDVRTVVQALGATHLIEGSVRKEGNRVRIAAQLVKADDGVNVWASSYDREMTDVFAIQEDIARAIAASLRMPLGLKPGEQLLNERTVNPASHENYLRAKALTRARDPKSFAEAIRILEETVAREPDFAPAWGLLGTAYHLTLLVNPAVLSGAIDEARPIVQANLAKGQAAAERAIKLDPKSADGYLALAEMRHDAGDHLSGMDLYQKALALDPDHPEALQGYSISLAHLGYVKQALPVRDQLLAVEPFVPAYQNSTARLLFSGGQTDAAIAILKKQRPGPLLPQIYAAQGRYREAADAEAAFGNIIRDPDPALSNILTTTVRLLRAAPAVAPPNDRPELGILDWVYLYVGAPERFLFIYEKGIRMGYQSGGANGLEWAPAYSAIRKTDRFKTYVRDAGMVAYWRKNGWPDLCHPIGTNDFACE